MAEPLQVHVSMYMLSLDKIDTKNQNFSADCKIEFKWYLDKREADIIKAYLQYKTQGQKYASVNISNHFSMTPTDKKYILIESDFERNEAKEKGHNAIPFSVSLCLHVF